MGYISIFALNKEFINYFRQNLLFKNIR